MATTSAIEDPEPEGEFFVMDFPGAKIVPSLLVQKSGFGWAFVGGNAPDETKGRPYRAGGPYTWHELRSRHPSGVLTRLVRAAADQAERAS